MGVGGGVVVGGGDTRVIVEVVLGGSGGGSGWGLWGGVVEETGGKWGEWGPAGKISTGRRACWKANWGMGPLRSCVAQRTSSSHESNQRWKEGNRDLRRLEREMRVEE